MSELDKMVDVTNWDIQNTYVIGGEGSYTVVTWLDGTPPIDEAASELDALRAVVEAARKYTDLSLSDEYCPNCLRRISDGHDNGCELDELAAALARMDGEK